MTSFWTEWCFNGREKKRGLKLFAFASTQAALLTDTHKAWCDEVEGAMHCNETMVQVWQVFAAEEMLTLAPAIYSTCRT